MTLISQNVQALQLTQKKKPTRSWYIISYEKIRKPPNHTRPQHTEQVHQPCQNKPLLYSEKRAEWASYQNRPGGFSLQLVPHSATGILDPNLHEDLSRTSSSASHQRLSHRKTPSPDGEILPIPPAECAGSTISPGIRNHKHCETSPS